MMDYSWKKTKEYIHADIYRNFGKFTKKMVIMLLLSNSTVAMLLYFRICQYCLYHRKNLLIYIVHIFSYIRFKHIQIKCGIELNQHTIIGYGLRIPHRGNIIIHPSTIIGNNCEIMQNVTIGNNILKDRDGVAKIGNNVLICAGAKIIGKIDIASCVVIGANAVVNNNIPEKSIVAGVPARVINNLYNNNYLINMYEINIGENKND